MYQGFVKRSTKQKIIMIYKAAFISLFLIGVSSSLKAQKNERISSVWNNDVKIDGELSEWNDSLTYYFDDQDLHYSISNDDQYLYVAIRVKNKDKQSQAVFNGFALTINRDGKKKDGPSFSYPIPDRSALRALSNQEFNAPTDLRKVALSTIRAFHVRNFPNILDGAISLENNYGIRAAVLIDTMDRLCYESAIQLDQLNLDTNQGGFAINIKINGLIKTQYTTGGARRNHRGSPYGYGNYYGYDDRPRTIISNREEPGTWRFITLAQREN